MRLCNVIVVGLAIAIAGAAFGQREKLAVGHKAPGLNIDVWVKGEEVTMASGTTYIVEFWATWCAPCRKSIPRLTALQERYGRDKLVIIGISEEEQEVVERFVKQQGDNMNYAVATDRRSATHRSWMQAAGIEGLPAVFIVDNRGNIAYIGRPMDDAFDLTLASVMTGRYDPVLQAQAAPMLKAARRARTVRNWRMALWHYDEVIDLSPMVFADVAIERFNMILVDMKDATQAYEYARQDLIGGKFATDSGALRMLAENIVTDPDVESADRDLAVAMAAAEQSLRLAGAVDPEALSAVALVHFHRGEIRQAVKLQTQAYFLARPERKAGYRRVLGSYRDAADRAGTG
jgi:thiol-disulfide isomerase/thioredoxin